MLSHTAACVIGTPEIAPAVDAGRNLLGIIGVVGRPLLCNTRGVDPAPHHGDAGIAHRKPLAIVGRLVADPSPGRNRGSLVDDRASNLGAPSDPHPIEQD